jgi:hypothetical protein
MQPESEAEDVPGRPDFVNVFQSLDRPIPATAVRARHPGAGALHHAPGLRHGVPPRSVPEDAVLGAVLRLRVHHACRGAVQGGPGALHRRAIHGVVPPALFELLGPSHGADRTVRFRSPDDREAAMEKQPFALDGASVRLVREGETSNVRRVRLD